MSLIRASVSFTTSGHLVLVCHALESPINPGVVLQPMGFLPPSPDLNYGFVFHPDFQQGLVISSLEDLPLNLRDNGFANVRDEFNLAGENWNSFQVDTLNLLSVMEALVKIFIDSSQIQTFVSSRITTNGGVAFCDFVSATRSRVLYNKAGAARYARVGALGGANNLVSFLDAGATSLGISSTTISDAERELADVFSRDVYGEGLTISGSTLSFIYAGLAFPINDAMSKRLSFYCRCLCSQIFTRSDIDWFGNFEPFEQ